MTKVPEFTQEQTDWICFQIGEWYLEWKNRIGGNHPHRLGFAKEILKEMVCPTKCGICHENHAVITWENCFECEMKDRADDYAESKL